MSDIHDRLALAAFILVIELGLLARMYLKMKADNMSLKRYLKTREGLGIIKGMILFPAILVAITFLGGCQGASYMNETKVFMGVDRSGGQSPLCDKGGPDDHISSNGGIEQNVIRYGRLDINGGYLHKSCAISSDYKAMDAYYIEGVWTLTEDLITAW